ncbi:TetR family transcriptional regulator [Nocardioides szechwanensis]|uniref:Transcriptional regulator, TetR family n=1 Tax=Nocardioides szechwanensis TaxID=1005944 RepID=A0A1G9WQM3_9ACTN|nr:TetR/AcrR family transcriptional regulator [Nocardioides szechwanensis]GEP32559.1 TetR family transcriptional regulator [Nocardioides szechwanensis]SDM86677.1 transcriptional regulator, TetR family [Nocardioides szechwanensis]
MISAARGDARRTALLESLDEILREQNLADSSLDSINIAEISRRAGVTRSAFYFYFENKQAAVAALMEEMYDQAFVATGELSGDATPAGNISATIIGLFDAWERHQHVFRAMLDARATSPAVRELWDSDRQSFVGPVAEMIGAERAAGRAPGGVDATSVATVLLELNDRMLERLALSGGTARPQLQEAVIEIWLRTIYGRTDQ